MERIRIVNMGDGNQLQVDGPVNSQWVVFIKDTGEIYIKDGLEKEKLLQKIYGPDQSNINNNFLTAIDKVFSSLNKELSLNDLKDLEY